MVSPFIDSGAIHLHVYFPATKQKMVPIIGKKNQTYPAREESQNFEKI